VRSRPQPIRPTWPPVGAWVVCSIGGRPVAAGRVESSHGWRRIRLVEPCACPRKVDWDPGLGVRVRVVGGRLARRVMADLWRSAGRGR